MTFTIDKGIPLPAPRSGCGVASPYPWATMEVGDSFLVDPPMTQGGIASVGYSAARRLGRKFATRKLPNGELRVWRTK